MATDRRRVRSRRSPPRPQGDSPPLAGRATARRTGSGALTRCPRAPPQFLDLPRLFLLHQGAQHPHRGELVLQLRPLVLAPQMSPGREVGDPDRGLVRCLPGTPARNESILRSSWEISTSSSGTAGVTITEANEVCRRAKSNGEIRTNRCTPVSPLAQQMPIDELAAVVRIQPQE